MKFIKELKPKLVVFRSLLAPASLKLERIAVELSTDAACLPELACSGLIEAAPAFLTDYLPSAGLPELACSGLIEATPASLSPMISLISCLPELACSGLIEARHSRMPAWSTASLSELACSGLIEAK